MPKTHYLGHTKAGKPVGRASRQDYGFTHAGVVPGFNRLPTFSTSHQGVVANLGRHAVDAEIVEVKIVTPAEYRAAMGARG